MSPPRRPAVALSVLALGVYAYFYQAGGWNQNARFDLTRAIVERGTITIDAYHENTGDKARRGDHWYCDKAPGLSWLAVPPYAVFHALAGPGAPDEGAYVATVFAVGLPSAIAVAALFAIGTSLGLSSAWAAAVAAAYALATLAFPYATLFYGHQPAAALGLVAYALARQRRALVAAGFLLGLAVCVDYTAAVLAVAITAYVAFTAGPRAAARVVLGGALPAVALAAYHAAAFGHPLALPYHFVLQEHRRMGLFMGIGAPDPAVLGELLFGPYRGLFYSAPWLALGLPGLIVLARRGHRAEAVLCGALFTTYLVMNAGMVDWQGGWAMGPRYLIPVVPYLAIGVMGLAGAARSPRARRAVVIPLGGLVAVSFALVLAGTAVRPDVPLTITRPYRDYILPAFRHGNLSRSNHGIDSIGSIGGRAAWNLGQKMGLERHASLVPLGAWLILAGAWVTRGCRTQCPPRGG